ncbi:cadherin-like domain-containing protein [uncultured Roseobacter sp.]|uniref:cadherin-like domain-containing protein n=1 Tax=uncultured Roseobacter sp. TaxID=114847 RepID=UPI0026144E59|nr:cadherin-like domain-containing protein [uncultured Roseobacter sp.]
MDNYLNYLGAGVDAETAGFPVDKYQHVLGGVAGILPNMFSAEGTIAYTASYGSRQYVSDVAFSINEDGPLLIGSADGTLDASGGQSGSPLWTYDTHYDGYRAMAVAVSASTDSFLFLQNATFEATIFELIDQNVFSWIMSEMAANGVVQPDYVTNRITGLFGNTNIDWITGGIYSDVLRGLGAAAGGEDILRGSFGNDYYEFAYGFGEATIQEPEGFGLDASIDDADTIVFRGVNAGDVRISRGFNDRDLYVWVFDPADSTEDLITIDDQFYSSGAIEFIQFDDFIVDISQGLLLTGTDTSSSETLDGTGFDDILLGLGGPDTLLGRKGNDILNGGQGDDSLYGGLNDDTYEYGAGYGSDGISEEGGFDTVQLLDLDFADIRLQRDIGVNSAFLTLYVHDGRQDLAGQRLGFGYQFSANTDTRLERLITADGIEIDLTGGLYFRGTDGYNAMAGTEFDDIVETRDGDDLIRSYGGDDLLDGGVGNDGLEGGFGGDTYVFRPGHGRDTISEIGRYGNVDVGPVDTILLDGFLPSDVRIVEDFQGRMTIYTTADNENWIYVPSQFYNYNPGSSPLIERIAFSNGTSIDLAIPGASTNAIPEGVGDYFSLSQRQPLELSFESLLMNDSDADTGTGLSIASVGNARGGSVVATGESVRFTPEQGFGGTAGFDYFVTDGIALVPVAVQITYPGTIGDDVFQGTANADVFRGFRGNDTLIGGLGDDTLNGGEGNDNISGGDGKDTVFGQQGNDQINGGDDDDQLFGEEGNDTINGGDGNDTIGGANGNDIVDGNAGNDTIFGGEGNDTVRGGLGNDRLFGNGGNDFVDGEAGDDEIFGETGADTLLGGDGADEINGGGGNDFMNGEGGNDRMFGGSNDDAMFGGSGNDLMDGQQQDDDLFGQAGNDTMFGGDGFDLLDGGSGNDTLFGGNQGDTLRGGAGTDFMDGGAGFDNFDFNAVSESAFGSADTISGFDGAGAPGGDVIDVSGIDANTTAGGNQAFTFLGAVTSAVGLGFGAGALWVQEFGGQTRLYGEVNGDGVIDFEVRINDGPGTVAGDYTLDEFLL